MVHGARWIVTLWLCLPVSDVAVLGLSAVTAFVGMFIGSSLLGRGTATGRTTERESNCWRFCGPHRPTHARGPATLQMSLPCQLVLARKNDHLSSLVGSRSLFSSLLLSSPLCSSLLLSAPLFSSLLLSSPLFSSLLLSSPLFSSLLLSSPLSLATRVKRTTRLQPNLASNSSIQRSCWRVARGRIGCSQ